MPVRKEHSPRTGCPIACALDIIGDHWTLVVVRDLMFANRHEFKEMLSAEEGIASNILVDACASLNITASLPSFPIPRVNAASSSTLRPRAKIWCPSWSRFAAGLSDISTISCAFPTTCGACSAKILLR